jgi:hypothetical protein
MFSSTLDSSLFENRILLSQIIGVSSYLVRARVWFGELDGDPAAFRHDALDKLAAGSNNRIVDLRRD